MIRTENLLVCRTSSRQHYLPCTYVFARDNQTRKYEMLTVAFTVPPEEKHLVPDSVRRCSVTLLDHLVERLPASW